MVVHSGEAGDVVVTRSPPVEFGGKNRGMVHIEIPIACDSFLTLDFEGAKITYGLWADEAQQLGELLLSAAEKARCK